MAERLLGKWICRALSARGGVGGRSGNPASARGRVWVNLACEAALLQ